MKQFISFVLGAVFAVMLCASQGLVTEVVVEKEIPVEVIVEKEVIKEVPVEVIVEKAPVELNKKYKEGTYKVGRDIPAGEYRAESNGGSMCDFIGVSIGENPNFNDYDEYDFTLYDNVALFIVKDGEYVRVEDADFYYLG